MTATSPDRGNGPIVLGVDTEPGPLATAWAADEADRRGLQLRLVHALPSVAREFRPFDEGQYHKALRERADQALTRAAAEARARHPDLTITTAVTEDVPAPALCRESAQATLVVLGTRRLNRIEEVLSLSSVAVPVSAQAHCPVAVVPGPEHITQAPPYVVVGVDGSPASEAAVRFALDLAARRGADVRAVLVRRRGLLGPFDPHTAEAHLRELLIGATARPQALHAGVRLTHEVLHGHPVEDLARAAEHALAVVVGRRGGGGFTGMRLGSVPHGLLHRADCPVVTVPGPSEKGTDHRASPGRLL
ncbi:universal stress protein [Kitasatospora purpeofusca]|uniref:universal stress protein n=1 Tax=Kitasatospora purpeofusca TaxID=67352 RepID=UPI002E16612E|nr:universal stress protein [Kitasatospora purpeofusca]